MDSNKSSGPSSGLKSMKEKLRELEMKKNAARGMLKKATEDEVMMEKAGPKALEKKEKEEEEKKLQQFKQKLQEDGIDPEKYHLLHQTQEAQEIQEKKKARKLPDADDVDVFGKDGQYHAFKRQRGHTDFDMEAYNRQKEDNGDAFYNPSTSLDYGNVVSDDPKRVQQMVEDVKAQQERNAKFSRRRAFNETDDVTFINERNRKFVQKINRAFDSYTEEIRENIERGTAI